MREEGNLSLFITFEGPEGSGKTTQIELLSEYLEEKGYPVLATREPGGTNIGDQIRAILLDPQNTEMLPASEALLFSSARAQIVNQVIRPHLARGGIVLCDRYADSTLAYQGYGHGLDLETLHTITALATGGLKPDLTIYLDIEVEEGLQRKFTAHKAGQAEWNRLDQQEAAFHRRVREGYLQMAAREPDRWLVIDATQLVEAIQASIRAGVEAKLVAAHLARPGLPNPGQMGQNQSNSACQSAGSGDPAGANEQLAKLDVGCSR
jgi:dTMP kinase